MFYKMFEHEPMNNPALGEAGLVRSVRVKKENSIILQKRDGSLLPCSIRRG